MAIVKNNERSEQSGLRLALLLPAGVALLAGLNAGLLLAGAPAPWQEPRLEDRHGMLMVLGFLGTLIALERAVALRRTGGFAAPALLGAGGLALITPLPALVGQLLLVAGLLALLWVYAGLYRRSRDDLVVVQALAAFLAKRSGQASDVFLPGLIQGGVMLAISVLSIAVRWPLVGFIVAGGDPNLKDDPTAWQRSRSMVRVCTRLTWVFAALFAIRLAVMVPLYLADDVTALGVCKIVLGWPLYLAALGLMVLLLVKGETPLESHDPLLHDDPEGHERLEHAEHVEDIAREENLGRGRNIRPAEVDEGR